MVIYSTVNKATTIINTYKTINKIVCDWVNGLTWYKPSWWMLHVVILLELEPISWCDEGIKFSYWSKYKSWSHISLVRLGARSVGFVPRIAFGPCMSGRTLIDALIGEVGLLTCGWPCLWWQNSTLGSFLLQCVQYLELFLPLPP